jgi:hypothetical protein
MVDITIDTDGRVAEAQIVGGLVPKKLSKHYFQQFANSSTAPQPATARPSHRNWKSSSMFQADAPALKPGTLQHPILDIQIEFANYRILSTNYCFISIHAGAWSLAFSSPRIHRSTPPLTSRSAVAGESSRWSSRMPLSFGQRSRL